MDLYQSISNRKSCRKYNMEPLPAKLLKEMEAAVKGFDVLDPAVPLEHRIVTETKGHLSVSAPHYLIISGQGKPGELEGAGYLYQQLVLWMNEKGIGSVWLGSTKAAETNQNGVDIITLAFGYPAEDVNRQRSEFKRKAIEKITNAPDDPCIQAVHLAPSGINLQPWYYEKSGDQVLVYRQKIKGPVALVYKLSDLDMGISLCHYAVACKKLGKEFQFKRESSLAEKKGFAGFGVIKN